MLRDSKVNLAYKLAKIDVLAVNEATYICPVEHLKNPDHENNN
jgi:hypothetical protein